jgi:CheY-like chemotaxis protein
MNPTQQHDTSRYRLLLVDDSPEEVRLLIERLRGAGYTLSVALDGERGYQRAISLRPDLILLDVHMPPTASHARHRINTHYFPECGRRH